jgi:hypothetical protein
MEPQYSLDSDTLSVEREGKKTTLAEGVDGFWPIALNQPVDGSGAVNHAVAFAKADGAGGYENEGESLYLWAAGYRESRKVLAEYFRVEHVESLGTRRGRTVLLIVMKDGGLGATHVALADPDRGEIFRADGAEVIERQPGLVRIGWFRDEDWDRMNEGASVRPVRSERLDLDAVWKRPVMHNPLQP